MVQSQLGAPWDRGCSGGPFPALCLCSRTMGFRGVTAPTLSTPSGCYFQTLTLHSSDPDDGRFTSRRRPRFLPYIPAGGRHTPLQPFGRPAARPRPLPGSVLQGFSAQAPPASVDAGLRLGSAGPWHGRPVQVWFACRSLTGALSAESPKLSFCPSQ